MKAMILAAGLGTRLRPLTEELPKALVEVHGIPMLEIIIRRLIRAGFNEIVINLHYLPEKIMYFLEKNTFTGVNIRLIREEPDILDTGGGIKNAASLLQGEEPFVVHNVDVISDIDLRAMVGYHKKAGGLATLAVQGKDSERGLLFDETMKLAGWENRASGLRKVVEKKQKARLVRYGFCGIHVIDTAIFDLMQEESKFSIIDTYIRLAGAHRILGYPVEDNFWTDIGSFEQLETANRREKVRKIVEL